MKTINSNMTWKEAKLLTPPQCPECGGWNVKVGRSAYVDFYGIPYVWRCDCGWKQEIGREE